MWSDNEWGRIFLFPKNAFSATKKAKNMKHDKISGNFNSVSFMRFVGFQVAFIGIVKPSTECHYM